MSRPFPQGNDGSGDISRSVSDYAASERSETYDIWSDTEPGEWSGTGSETDDGNPPPGSSGDSVLDALVRHVEGYLPVQPSRGVLKVAAAENSAGDYTAVQFSADAETAADAVDIHAAKRLAAVEDVCGIRLNLILMPDDETVFDMAKASLLAAVNDYNIFVADFCSMSQLSVFGGLGDFASDEDWNVIDPADEWWADDAVLGLGFGGKHYLLSGEALISSRANTHAVLFNRDLIYDETGEDPYTLYTEGDWTLESFERIARAVSESGGLGAAGTYQAFEAFMIGAEVHPILRDGDKRPVSAFELSDAEFERLSDSIARIYGIMSADYSAFEDDKSGHDAFYGGDTAFLVANLADTDADALRAMSPSVGVLPLPKSDSDQESFFGAAVADCSQAVGILPFEFEDMHASSVVLDALAYYSYLTEGDVFADTFLSARGMDDAQNRAALTDLLGSRASDIASAYGQIDGAHIYGEISGELKENISADLDAVLERVYETVRAYSEAAKNDIEYGFFE